MFLRNPGTPPMDTAHSNRILLTMVGVSMLMTFMDLQAARQLKDQIKERIESVPANILSGEAPITADELRAARANAAEMTGNLPALPSSVQPVKQSAESIFNGVHTRVTERVESIRPDSRVSSNGGWDLFYIQYKGNQSELIRVHRIWPGSSVPVRTVLQYLLKGPSSQERGALNPFEGVKIVRTQLTSGILTVECDPALLKMSSHVVQDRLDQIVYTMTQFPEIQGVRFLVDGERKPYLDRVLKRSARRFRTFE